MPIKALLSHDGSGPTIMLQVMSWMEQCAYISASRLRAQHVLTAAIDALVFKQPTRVADIMYITAQVGGGDGSGKCHTQRHCTYGGWCILCWELAAFTWPLLA